MGRVTHAFIANRADYLYVNFFNSCFCLQVDSQRVRQKLEIDASYQYNGMRGNESFHILLPYSLRCGKTK